MIQLPPDHCDLNAIDLIWADEKNCVARENREMTLKSVEALFRECRSQITAEKCKKCIFLNTNTNNTIHNMIGYNTAQTHGMRIQYNTVQRISP